ncbi:hypothetical protein ACIRJO_42065 [Streptomyces sp. NPDC102394]|uniref:hypothetical protein n=1 Tax=Streptomyces sp. NPDC102394 TaxID=3366167 RepID=UPI0038111665
MEGKKDGPPSCEPTRETELTKEDKKKGPNWAAASFVINLLRFMHDWWINK